MVELINPTAPENSLGSHAAPVPGNSLNMRVPSKVTLGQPLEPLSFLVLLTIKQKRENIIAALFYFSPDHSTRHPQLYV